jgi:dienelactone hydrolase
MMPYDDRGASVKVSILPAPPLTALVVAGVFLAMVLGGCGGHAKSGSESSSTSGPFAYNRDQPLAPQVVAVNPIGGDETMSVSYVGADNDHVPALLALPPGGAKVPCIMYLHGLGRSKNDAVPLIAPLARLGIGVMAIDAPYQGARSQGKAALDSVLHNPTRLTAMLRQTAIDVRRGLDVLDERRECDPNRLGLVGFSFGAVIAAAVAGSDTRVRATVLLSASGDWRPALRDPGILIAPDESHNTAEYDAYLKALAPWNPAHWVGHIAPRPLLMVNGTHDELTTVAAEQALHKAAG